MALVSYVMIKNAWDNVLSCCEEISEDIKANASKNIPNITNPATFLVANNKLTTIERRKESNLHITTTTSCLTSANVHDSSEQKSVQDTIFITHFLIKINYFKKLLQYKNFRLTLIASCLRQKRHENE